MFVVSDTNKKHLFPPNFKQTLHINFWVLIRLGIIETIMKWHFFFGAVGLEKNKLFHVFCVGDYHEMAFFFGAVGLEKN